MTNSDDENCSICMGPMVDPVYLPCLHVFCRSCITEYVASGIAIATLEEALRSELDDLTPIHCPLCRNTVFARRNQEVIYPEAKTCGGCEKYITRIVQFPCCHFQNESNCLSCEIGNDTGDVSCPHCLNEFNASDLTSLTLCLFCNELKEERTPTCICQGPVTVLNLHHIISMLIAAQAEQRRQSDHNGERGVGTNAEPTVQQTGQRDAVVRPPSRQAITREILRSPIFRILVVLVFGVLLWYGVYHIFIGEKKHVESNRRDGRLRICRDREMWVVNERGVVHKTPCDSDWVPYLKKTKTKEEGDLKKQSTVAVPAAERKVPVHKECYPRTVWLVSPEGEVHAKQCEYY